MKSEGDLNSFSRDLNEEGPSFYRENYPNLFLASVAMANGYPESDDKNRFMDLKKNGKRNKRNTQKVTMNVIRDIKAKKEHKHIRHFAQRIISIAEVLEEISYDIMAEKQK